MKLEEITCGLQNPSFLSNNIIVVLLAVSHQGFKSCTWFISSKMYRNREDINSNIYVKISTGTTISQAILKQTVNKNNIHVLVGVSQVSQLVVMILLINDCYIMSLVVIISRMNFVLYRNNCLPSITKNKIEQVFENHNRNYSFQSFSSLSIDASFCLY